MLPEQSQSPLKRLFIDRERPESHHKSLAEKKYRYQAANSLGMLYERLKFVPSGSYAHYELKTSSVQTLADSIEDCFVLSINVSPDMNTLRPKNNLKHQNTDWQTQVQFAATEDVLITMKKYDEFKPEFRTYRMLFGMCTYEVNNNLVAMEVSDYTDLIYLTETIANGL